MLNRLHIQNYAIIDELNIDFASQLNIITGETGAGKSILMGALNLILGERADSSVLQNDNKKCIVEGYFQVNNKQLNDFLIANDLDLGEEVVIRREITTNGKSRSFINDSPANLGQLKELATMLVDLHQQFDTLHLGNENFQRMVLDALAGNGVLLSELSVVYTNYNSARKKLDSLIEQQLNSNKELDYNRFLFDELEELALKENELEELDVELKLLSNAENIKQELSAVYFQLKDSEEPIVQQLKVIGNKLNALQEFHPSIKELQQRLNSAMLEIKDVADELEQMDSGIHYDAQRIAVVNDRIAAGYKLQKKHGVTTTGELLAIRESLSEKLLSLSNLSSEIERAEKEVKALEKESLNISEKISLNRQKQIRPFTEKVNGLLAKVGMPNARINVSLQASPLSIYGTDLIEYLFDANKSGRFEPMRKVASGGELSRLMLSIKSLVARKLQLPTLIFDEIDTGISGEAAIQVGLIMKDLSASHQLIAITHQPQIAAKADAHYFVFKQIKGDKIVTSIRLLNNDERITTIAQMLGGEKPTAAAMENAREMVRN